MPEKTIYQFGTFCLDESERALSYAETIIPLNQKCFETLLLLVSRAGKLVSKEDFFAAIWPTSCVEEHALTVNISTLRQILKRHDPATNYIETVPKAGYRFVAAVSTIKKSPIDQQLFERALAVLPFKLMGFDQDKAYLGLGISDALITRLSKLKSLAVRPLSSVLRYQNPSLERNHAGTELGARYVLDGYMQQDGGNLRTSLHLIETSTQKTLLANTFESQMTSIFALQDSIAEQVTDTLLPMLSQIERQEMAKRPTENLQAYNSYLMGRYYWATSTVDSMQLALKHFQQAIEMDPNFALPYCGKADYYAMRSWAGNIPPHEAMPIAMEAALKAIELDDALSQAYSSLGLVLMTYEFDWQGAEEAFKKAAEINPGEEATCFWMVALKCATSRFAEARAIVNQAISLYPLSPLIRTVEAISEYYSGHYEKAVAACQEALKLLPGFPPALFLLGLNLTAQAKYEEAITELQQSVAASGRMIKDISALACAYARAGKRNEAEAILNELLQRAEQEYIQPALIATIYAALGENDSAFEWLEKAFEDKHGFLIYLNVEPAFDSLRTDPRFTDLLERMRLNRTIS